ncbi:MAG: NAD-dependent epimerase/dehydratase family protein [Deltaproteobacteria bacterium]|nr:MAG: NAD-dependent epimerase/dehydratase family protein [Deltaproteobacteria bacterium]
MKTLITGASGFVGSAVLRQLLQADHKVRALVRPSSDRSNLTGLPVEIVTGDLTEPQSLVDALLDCDALFHVAADYRLWVPDPDTMYEINVTGTRNLMLAASRVGLNRIVYTSSVATLGLTFDGSPADETTPVALDDMIGHYKRSKFLAEAEVRRLADDQELPVVIVNPSTPVGPRDLKPTPTGRMIVDAARGRMPAYVDTGLNLVHVDDVAVGHLLAFERGTTGRRYVLGGRNLSLKEILGQIAIISGQKPPTLRLPHNLVLPLAYLNEAWARMAGVGEPRVTVDGVRLAKKHMFFSSDRAERELGFNPRPVEEALRDAVDWFRQNGYLI